MSVELGNELKGMISGYIEAKKLSDVSVATVIDPSGPIIQIEGNEGPLPAAAVSVPDYLSGNLRYFPRRGTFRDSDN